MEAEPRRWAATYTRHLKQKRKAYQDGALLLHPGTGRLVLLDHAGDTLESRFLRTSEEVSPGSALSFHSYLVDVGEPEPFSVGFPTSATSSAAASASMTAAHRGGGARARPPSVARRANPRVPQGFMNPSKSRAGGGGGEEGEAEGFGGADVTGSGFQEWTALYTTQLTQKAKKYHDGVVRLMQAGLHVKQIVLLDDDGQVLGSRHLKSGETIETGKKCIFPNYLIEICEVNNEKKGVDHTSEEEPVVHTKAQRGENATKMMGLSAASRSQKFISPQNCHDLEKAEAEVTASCGKPATGKVEVVAAGSSGSLMGTNSSSTEWTALYTTQLTQKAKKYHDGVIRLMQVGSHARQIVLLDEDGEVLGSRYLKSVESVESGTKCQMPNYLIEVSELISHKNEAKHSSEVASRTGPRNVENTSGKMGAKSKSPKFVSPFKSQDNQKSNWESTTSSNRQQISKITCSNMDGSRNTHVLSDLRRGNSNCDFNRRADHGSDTAFTDIQRGTPTNYIWPELGKSSSSGIGDLLQFHDLQDDKSRRGIAKSTFGNMDDSVRTASQILSIMKPPSEVQNSHSAPSGQARSLVSSESRISLDASRRNNSVVADSNRSFDGHSGLSHFATQLRTSVQSCLSLGTLQRKNTVMPHHWNESSGNSDQIYVHKDIMRPAGFESQDLDIKDIPASDMSSTREEKLDSNNHHTGSSNDIIPFMNVATDPGLDENRSGTVEELSTQNSIVDGRCAGPTSTSSFTLTCKDPKIQELIDDCPSFDLGF